MIGIFVFPRCKEIFNSQEERRENNNFDNYQDQVLVYNTESNNWQRGPSLLQRRKNHGCTLVNVSNRYVSLIVLHASYILTFHIGLVLGNHGCRWFQQQRFILKHS